MGFLMPKAPAPPPPPPPPAPPPAFDDESSNELFDVFVSNATEFTYQYMKDNHLYCEAMNKMIQDYGHEWALLEESD